MDLDAYRAQAERFVGELGREYYRHYAGLKDDFELEAIYQRHRALFTAEAVDRLRCAADGGDSDEARRRRALLEFCVEGHLGQATKAAEAELARREVELQVEVDGGRIGYRESSVVQANEPDRSRRERIEQARLELVERELNPLRREAVEQDHALARELGWPSYRAMFEQLRGIDLDALALQTAAFCAATEDAYPDLVEPALRRTTGVGLAEARRSDLPWLFRAAHLDGLFPAQELVASFRATMTALGIDLDAQRNVTLDVDPRPNKSPRPFCAPVRVPDEVYLVLSPIGGRDDYVALFHEGGHTEHFASVDPRLPFEFRHLGDNSVTEGFAFLFDHLVEDPLWLRRRLGIEESGEVAAHARAQGVVFMRRYAAKLAYELELHAGERPLDELADVYARRVGAAVGMAWPRGTYLTDVDPGFYAASYLRAWSLETHLRAALRDRFGAAWFDEPAAGDYLRSLWRDGQRLSADELVHEIDGGRLDFTALLADLSLAPKN